MTIPLPCDKMNLFDISHITAEEAKVFKSDFWHVADYFSQINETNDYIPNKTRLDHPEEMFKLMKFLTGNEKFDNIISVDKGGPATMFDAFEAAEKRGEARGKARGEAIGKEKGKESIIKLLKQLYALGRDADAKRAITDEQYLAKLMKEFAIQ